MTEQETVENENGDLQFPRGASLVLVAVVISTQLPRLAATRRATPRELTRLAKIAARPLPRATSPPVRDLWDVEAGFASIDKCAGSACNWRINYICNKKWNFDFQAAGITLTITNADQTSIIRAEIPAKPLQLRKMQHVK